MRSQRLRCQGRGGSGQSTSERWFFVIVSSTEDLHLVLPHAYSILYVFMYVKYPGNVFLTVACAE